MNFESQNMRYSILIHHSLVFSFTVAPTFVVVPPKTFEASVGEKAVMKCYADGYPRPQITWSRTTGSSKGNLAASNGTWVIDSVEMQDFGRYHCTATNSLGSMTHSFRVSPTGATILFLLPLHMCLILSL